MLSVATNCLVCAGYDLIEWLMDRLCIEDSRKLLLTQHNTELELEVSTVSMFVAVEAVHLANLLCQFGYYFPVSEQKNLLVKDDSSLYRFQVAVRSYVLCPSWTWGALVPWAAGIEELLPSRLAHLQNTFTDPLPQPPLQPLASNLQL